MRPWLPNLRPPPQTAFPFVCSDDLVTPRHYPSSRKRKKLGLWVRPRTGQCEGCEHKKTAGWLPADSPSTSTPTRLSGRGRTLSLANGAGGTLGGPGRKGSLPFFNAQKKTWQISMITEIVVILGVCIGLTKKTLCELVLNGFGAYVVTCSHLHFLAFLSGGMFALHNSAIIRPQPQLWVRNKYFTWPPGFTGRGPGGGGCCRGCGAAVDERRGGQGLS